VTPPAAAAAAPGVHRGRTAAPPRPAVAPRRPRRVSGPARQPARGLERPLDRLIRGRTWIALIAFALIGIVTLQLLVLKLNANIGRALVREGQLQRENAALSIESSELAAGERVETQAAHLGMQLVPDGALRFLSINPKGDIARAARALSAPMHTANTASSAEASTTASGQTSTEATEATEASTTPPQTSSESTDASSEPSGESAATPASASETAPTGEQSATASATGAAEASPSSGAG